MLSGCRELIRGSYAGDIIPQTKSTSIPDYYVPKVELLAKSDVGSKISLIQSWLNKLGYYTGTRNGVFTRRTREAVRRFQRDYGLVDHGMVDGRTYDTLRRAVGIPEEEGGGFGLGTLITLGIIAYSTMG